jgi:hypothetical protein
VDYRASAKGVDRLLLNLLTFGEYAEVEAKRRLANSLGFEPDATDATVGG